MPNTKVTVTYANGSIREFVASDDLEQMINDGYMFSVTTFHSDMGVAEEMLVSKMYAGNPIAALGHMMMMKRNAEKVLEDDEDEDMFNVIATLNVCIKFMTDEITSHQSEMSPVIDNESRQFKKSEPLVPVDMTQMGDDEHCEHGKKMNDYCQPCGRIHGGS